MKIEELLRTRSPSSAAATPLGDTRSAPQVEPVGPPSHPDVRELLARLPTIESEAGCPLLPRELRLIRAVCKGVSADQFYQPPASDLAIIRSINAKLALEDVHEAS